MRHCTGYKYPLLDLEFDGYNARPVPKPIQKIIERSERIFECLGKGQIQNLGGTINPRQVSPEGRFPRQNAYQPILRYL